ncbi:Mrp/NBP35 family ATP-binding protein [Allofrancisella guangzhouensis]|uniref:Iron-sulfur cluster carrier protein n=1 Tax=Allofrancisella guangzhouensis TaxID=594679 RepID=A0A0A8E4H1_9GAMM|nr:Mrp/NBP35 family ATP-binding protein [Allofrancisella guangzhouensis]AJC49090.1 sodium:proton antiporter [Allofrancisella guangzhouensis]MBK2027851.1 Mrp/NBP35 family ATP-binding protein [Allofrancisella guangzhouensis]MBK2044838.1 Mrp/NBP35 family ATP-binding protein [Allofrancisella guangzhouensis]MBK2046298.1 Mrp/NBP35 family ATP-binding protein [Allofrancisella guangzhouensis]
MKKIENVEKKKVQAGQKLLPNIKNIILVASGKGGVGKSTVTTNLAVAFAKMGAQVGILDADIYGPSQPTLLNLKDNPKTTDKKKIIPLERYGVKMISIGNLIDPESAVIWRGPIVSRALMQLLNDTDWQDIDYLFLDLPPGTGDIQLTISKNMPVTGAVIVTTPQDLSLIDARRAIAMFEKVDIKTLGIVENMSYYICPKCGNSEHIFGEDGAHLLCGKNNIEFLGSLPLHKDIRENADLGKPYISLGKDDNITTSYLTVAENLLHEIQKLPKASSLDSIGVKLEK